MMLTCQVLFANWAPACRVLVDNVGKPKYVQDRNLFGQTLGWWCLINNVNVDSGVVPKLKKY